MGTDKLLWLLAAISFGLGAFLPLFPRPGKLSVVSWMLAGFMFISLTFVF